VELAERRWIAGVRASDEGAFDEIFAAYYASLCDFACSYLRSRADAEEVVQTVFLRLWEKRSVWDPTTSIRAYLFAACRNEALNALKHVRVIDRTAGLMTATDQPPGVGSRSPHADEAVQHAELSDAIHHAIDALPERRKQVVVLRWQHQLTNVEIARVLGISVKGVEAHVARAMTALRERLKAFR
jgi:RNA polymerase sigma-70 factor, ECF subfamily